MDLTREEIEKQLDSVKDEHKKIDLMNYYASRMFLQDDEYPEQLIEKAHFLSSKTGYQKGIAQSLLNKAIRTFKYGDFETMLEFAEESEKIMRKLPDQDQMGKLGLHRVLNCKGVCYNNQGSYKRAVKTFKKAIILCRNVGDLDTLGNIYCNLATLYSILENPRKALEYSLEGLTVLRNSTNSAGVITILEMAGTICSKLGDNLRALSYLEEAYNLLKENELDKLEPLILGSMSGVYRKMGDLTKTEELLTLSLELARKKHTPEEEIIALKQLGILYHQMRDLEKAENYFLEALECLKKCKIESHQRDIHKQLELLYIEKGDFEKAHCHLEHYFLLEKKTFDLQMNDKMRSIESDSLRQAQERIKIISTIGCRIISSLDMSMVLDLIYNHINSIMDATHFGIAIINPGKKQIDFALVVEESVHIEPFFISLDDKGSLAALAVREDKDIIINDFSKEYLLFLPGRPEENSSFFGSTSKKVPQSILCCPLRISGEITGVIMVESYKKHAYSIWDLDSLKALASYVAIALKNASQSGIIRQQNEKLSSANSRLGQMMGELEFKNSQIISSLGYAERIQYAILPSVMIIKEFFCDFFLLYQPRDIVGGDLYWFRKDDRGLLCIIGDCTGHGIPGALMVMAVNTLLTKINDDSCYDNPALLLSEVNRMLKKTLKQDNDIQSDRSLGGDGADLGICFINQNRQQMTFAGANLSLFYVLPQHVAELRGDRVSIGYKECSNEYSYTNHTVQLDKGVSYYLATDGYYDQIGGKLGFPLGRENFKHFLLTIQDKNMTEQKKILKKNLSVYKNDEKQIDDITVLGFRI